MTQTRLRPSILKEEPIGDTCSRPVALTPGQGTPALGLSDQHFHIKRNFESNFLQRRDVSYNFSTSFFILFYHQINRTRIPKIEKKKTFLDSKEAVKEINRGESRTTF